MPSSLQSAIGEPDAAGRIGGEGRSDNGEAVDVAAIAGECHGCRHGGDRGDARRAGGRGRDRGGEFRNPKKRHGAIKHVEPGRSREAFHDGAQGRPPETPSIDAEAVPSMPMGSAGSAAISPSAISTARNCASYAAPLASAASTIARSPARLPPFTSARARPARRRRSRIDSVAAVDPASKPSMRTLSAESRRSAVRSRNQSVESTMPRQSAGHPQGARQAGKIRREVERAKASVPSTAGRFAKVISSAPEAPLPSSMNSAFSTERPSPERRGAEPARLAERRARPDRAAEPGREAAKRGRGDFQPAVHPRRG